MGYVLGLDLGPTSVGWAAIEVDENGDFIGFSKIQDGKESKPAIGVRHFQINIEKFGSGDSEQTKMSKRRNKRLQRRRLRRGRGRKKRLIKILQNNGLLPKTDIELQKLLKKDPYEWRARAIKEKVNPYKVGRVLYHIAQRRGFKTNSKLEEQTKNKKEENKLSEFENAKKKAEIELRGNTIGTFLHEKRKDNHHLAIRNREGQDATEWRVFQREQYFKEVKTICEKQGLPKELTFKLLKNEEDKDNDKLLFWQQTYKLSERKRKRIVGRCSLMPSELRCPLSNRKAQEFRMLQKVNDLEFITNGNRELLSRKGNLWRQLVEELSLVKEMTFDEIRTKLKLDDEVRFNFEYKGNKRLIGNEADAELCNVFGEDNIRKKLPQGVDREQVWEDLIGYLESNKIKEDMFLEAMREEYGLETNDPTKITKIWLRESHCAFCEDVLDALLTRMRKGISFYEAKENVCKILGLKKAWPVADALPEPDKYHGTEITNPAVKNALYQVQRIVNTLIKEMKGKPDRIVVELTRPMKESKKQREKIIEEQSEKQKERETVKKLICDIHEWDQNEAHKVPEWQVERYRLWQQQKGRCVYSYPARCISAQTELFSRNVEVDHILPLGISLDNSLSNKVVCFASENQAKGERTPIDWLKDKEPEKWENVQQLIRHWGPKSKKRPITFENCDGYKQEIELRADKDKRKRFFVKTKDIRELYKPGNMLADTMYITTEVRKYLQRLYPAKIADDIVGTTKGGITAELRKIWGLNSILGAKENKKNRSDLRHHAIDAAVSAIMQERLIERVTSAIQKHWEENKGDSIKKGYKYLKAPKPWDWFREELQDAINGIQVSHQVDHRIHGALLDEQPFGLSKEVKEAFEKKDGMTQISERAWLCEKPMLYTRRRPIETALKNIGNIGQIPKEHEKIKASVESRLKETGLDINDKKIKIPKNTLQGLEVEDKKGRKISVKKIQILEPHGNMIIMTDGNKKPYAAYPSGENHHIEIFKRMKNGKPQYICKLWPMIELTWKVKDAVRKKQKVSVTIKKHPQYDDAEFVMALIKHDSVLMTDKEGREVLARIESISQNIPGDPRSIYLKTIPAELVDDKFLESEKEKKQFRNDWLIQSVEGIFKRNIRKITVDPLGRIRRASD